MTINTYEVNDLHLSHLLQIFLSSLLGKNSSAEIHSRLLCPTKTRSHVTFWCVLNSPVHYCSPSTLGHYNSGVTLPYGRVNSEMRESRFRLCVCAVLVSIELLQFSQAKNSCYSRKYRTAVFVSIELLLFS